MSEQEQQQINELDILVDEAQASEQQAEQPAGKGEWVPNDDATMQEQLENMPAAQLVTDFLGITFGIMSEWRGQHWQPNENLIGMAGKEYGALIDKNKDRITLPPWFGILAVTGSLFLKPALGEMEIMKAKKQAEQESGEVQETEEGEIDGD